jgi:hypothetical protein
MAEQPKSFPVEDDHPLIGVFANENGKDITRYFSYEEAADAAANGSSLVAALGVIGAWSDLDWDEMEAALDRIRHESQPTPPIDEL